MVGPKLPGYTWIPIAKTCQRHQNLNFTQFYLIVLSCTHKITYLDGPYKSGRQLLLFVVGRFGIHAKSGDTPWTYPSCDRDIMLRASRTGSSLARTGSSNSLVPRLCAFVACSTNLCANFVVQATNAQGLGTRLNPYCMQAFTLWTTQNASQSRFCCGLTCERKLPLALPTLHALWGHGLSLHTRPHAA